VQDITVRLHKIDVAKRQLDTAITLFLAGGEPCSIISLAAARMKEIKRANA